MQEKQEQIRLEKRNEGMIDSAEHPSLKGDDDQRSYNSQAYPGML